MEYWEKRETLVRKITGVEELLEVVTKESKET
jgi:hypothetical protein